MKDRGAFRTIGELSKELKIKPHILRYWEEQFAMLQPLKRAGARRHYRPEDVEMVQTINRLLNEEGYTIKGARKYLTSRKNKPAPVHIDETTTASEAAQTALPLGQNQVEDKSLIVEELKSIRNRLSRALSEA